MRALLILISAAVLSLPAIAQQTPPPAPGSSSTAADRMGHVLFDAAEKAVIERFFGRTATAAPTDVQSTIEEGVRRVIGAATGTSDEARDADDDKSDADDGRGKKSKDWKKNKKNKGKGQGRGKGLPPGLQKRIDAGKGLPPGLQKQLETNGRLPSGLQKRELPDDLARQLPPAEDGTERVIAGDNVVLIHEATGVVLDILRDVVTK